MERCGYACYLLPQSGLTVKLTHNCWHDVWENETKWTNVMCVHQSLPALAEKYDSIAAQLMAEDEEVGSENMVTAAHRERIRAFLVAEGQA